MSWQLLAGFILVPSGLRRSDRRLLRVFKVVWTLASVRAASFLLGRASSWFISGAADGAAAAASSADVSGASPFPS